MATHRDFFRQEVKGVLLQLEGSLHKWSSSLAGQQNNSPAYPQESSTKNSAGHLMMQPDVQQWMRMLSVLSPAGTLQVRHCVKEVAEQVDCKLELALLNAGTNYSKK